MIRTRLLIAAAVGCLALALALHGRAIDRTWFAALNATLWTWLPPATLSCVTLMGHGLAATMLMSPTLLLSTRTLAAALWSAPVALALSRLPKAMVDSPRPAAVLDAASMHLEGQALLGHNSFPSGHSITAFMLVSVLLLSLPGRLRPATAAAAAAIVAFGVAVALSRLGVGAHWPSDVIAGAGLGLLAGVSGSTLAQRWPLPDGRRTRAVLALLLGAGAVQLARVDTGYPGAQPAQWLLAALGGGIALAALWRAARPAPPSAAGAGAR
jgi:membrane-associated phospholipid phosphatase